MFQIIGKADLRQLAKLTGLTDFHYLVT